MTASHGGPAGKGQDRDLDPEGNLMAGGLGGQSWEVWKRTVPTFLEAKFKGDRVRSSGHCKLGTAQEMPTSFN